MVFGAHSRFANARFSFIDAPTIAAQQTKIKRSIESANLKQKRTVTNQYSSATSSHNSTLCANANMRKNRRLTNDDNARHDGDRDLPR
jgi:hypothetical protein